MSDLKIRVSNVMAWVGFSTLCSVVMVILLGVPQGLYHLHLRKQPPSDCLSRSDCYILTRDDIRSSPNLRRLGAESGDWLVQDMLNRQVPRWATSSRGMIKGFIDSTWNPSVSLTVWALLSLFNYILIGSFRFLPWRKIYFEEDN